MVLGAAILFLEEIVPVVSMRSCRNPSMGTCRSGLGLGNLAVSRIGLQQFLMGAGGNDATVFHDHDPVCIPDGIDLLADDDRGPVF